ncbi:integral membrane protein [Streptomyces sp. 769]|uniref:CPBP family intramembrane metalloprotease n=1 Tax=Streptomyces yunnanensis TaxID=156453 RepID=A0ABY8AGI3_9ACTN|nr:CPBP family intramembrane glutamic endopeptidase [Streptomyces yunnanensis]AJC60040.1 integral membrane protein [Streptomyces sp. 769]WEB43923.1 CPBP family intramembrane metalloprotease [Streptomyces yunnanensis]
MAGADVPGAGSGSGRPVEAAGEPARSVLRNEILIVLALSLGASAVSALISFIGSLTKPGGLKHQAATLNASHAPGRPWLDLAWQLFGIATALVPVVLVAHLLMRERAGGLRAIGFDRRRPGFDLGVGTGLAAAIGGSGLLLYLGARAAGFNLTVVPEALPDVWWKIPVLIASAVQNAVLEEVIVVGYLLRRLGQLGWTPWAAVAVSSVLRGSYHLYQGIGGFVGNMVMGVIFALVYRRWGRVGPLVAAHALIDIVAFLGYALLAGRVPWLPTG